MTAGTTPTSNFLPNSFGADKVEIYVINELIVTKDYNLFVQIYLQYVAVCGIFKLKNIGGYAYNLKGGTK